jgi:hypothetical protein
VIRNFNLGISFVPSTSNPSQIFVSNTLISDNTSDGIQIQPAGSGTTYGVLGHVDIENNSGSGIFIFTNTQTINITVSDSVSSHNGAIGIVATSGGGTPVNTMVRNSTIANNQTGVEAANTGGSVRVTRSTITGNATGWANAGTGGQVTSYADNNIEDNGTANNAPTQIIYK